VPRVRFGFRLWTRGSASLPLIFSQLRVFAPVRERRPAQNRVWRLRIAESSDGTPRLPKKLDGLRFLNDPVSASNKARSVSFQRVRMDTRVRVVDFLGCAGIASCSIASRHVSTDNRVRASRPESDSFRLSGQDVLLINGSQRPITPGR